MNPKMLISLHFFTFFALVFQISNHFPVVCAFGDSSRGGAADSRGLPPNPSFNRTQYNPFSTPARSAIHELKGGSTRIQRRKHSSSSSGSRSHGKVDGSRMWTLPRNHVERMRTPTVWKPLPQSSSSRRSSTSAIPTRSSVSKQVPTVTSSTTKTRKAKKDESLSRVDISVAMAYFCNAFAITLPIILTPMIAQGYGLDASDMTSFCGRVASTAIMGGGAGKIINGLVCQKIGGITTASSYLLGLGICTLALSLSTSLDSVRWLVAGMEFFSSAMWVASTIILSNYYSKQPLKFARGITCLSLFSTAAQLTAKTGGAALLKVMNWRQVAQIGAIMTLMGSLVVKMIIANDVGSSRSVSTRRSASTSSSPESMLSVIRQAKSVVGSKLFWAIGIAHVSGFLAKTSDRMLGPFLRDVTGLPYQVCGGLTASVTFGFVYGVTKAQAFLQLKSVQEKNQQLTKLYSKAFAALVGLVAVSSETARTHLSPNALAAIIVLCSAIFSSSVAFQFFQFPGIVATVSFKENKAICLSFLEGLAFFLTAPIWGLSSKMIEGMGWSASWAFIAMVFGSAAALMMNTFQPVLVQHAKQGS